MADEMEHMQHLMHELDVYRLGEMGNFIKAFRARRRQLRGSAPAQLDLLSQFNVAPLAETQHSAFLAWLLDADGSHNQGDLFLRAFLDVCQPKPGLAIPQEYHVQTEFWGGQSSIDILVYQAKEFLLYIENKTGSPDTSGQLDREFQDMRRLGRAFGIPPHCQALVYLTPTGRLPQSNQAYPAEWHSVSYRDLGQVLEALLPHLEDDRLKFALETWLDTLLEFTHTWRTTMKGFSEESVLLAKNWATVLKIIEAKERIDQELSSILSSVEAELKTLGWWGPGWRFGPEYTPGFFISNSNWAPDKGQEVVWMGVCDFDTKHVFGLGTPPTLYVEFLEGYDDLKRMLLDKWDSQHEVDIRYEEASLYPIVQDLPQCLEEESAVRAYPDAVRRQMITFFTHYATRLIDADKLIREHMPGGKKRKARA